MKTSFAVRSLQFLGLSILFLTTFTLVESAMSGVSSAFQRFLTALALILPSGIGAILAAISLFRKEGRLWLAIIGFVLNGLFALFFILLVLIGG